MTEKEYKELQERNRIRLIEAKIKLGVKYLLHPDNAINKQKKEALK